MCEACDHRQRTAIEEDIRSGMRAAPVAKKYGLRHHASVIQHQRRHMLDMPAPLRPVQYEIQPRAADIELARADADEMPGVLGLVQYEASAMTPMEALKPALPHVRHAMQLAGENRQEQERIVATLNQLLQDEQMGLP